MLRQIFIFFLLCSVGYGQSERSSLLFNHAGGPSCELLDALDFIGVEHDGSWESIVAQTQKLLRKPNQELWQIDPRTDLPLDEAYKHFRCLGMIDSYVASKKHYRYAAVLGATLDVVKARFLFLKEEWEKGVRFEELVIMGGQRPLASFERGVGQTETDMMLHLFHELDLPEQWHSMPMTIIDSKIPEGKNRPQTMHPFMDWMKISPEPGSVLIVSSQPFIGRQDAIARHLIPFPIETIGMGVGYDHFCKEPLAVAIMIETLARWIYEAVVVKEACFLNESQRTLKICGTITSASTKSKFPQIALTPAIDPQKIVAAVMR